MGNFIGEVVPLGGGTLVKTIYYVGINGNHCFVADTSRVLKRLNTIQYNQWKTMSIKPFKNPKNNRKNPDYNDLKAVYLCYDFETTTI